MMSVSEYAIDINKTVKEILKKCKELNIEVENEESMLDEEAITELDNIIANEEEIDAFEDEDELIEKEKNKIEVINKNNSKKKQQNNNKVGKKDLAKKKKEMYKHKEKLMSNAPSENKNVITYRDGMSIGDLAKSLNVTPAELIKKLFTIGILATVNNSLNFENAELLVSDYGKELQLEKKIDETNFEEFEIKDN